MSIFYRSPLPTGPTGIQSERVIITAREPYPSILGLVLRNEAIPNRIVLANDQITVVSTVRDWEQFRELGDDIEHKLGTFGLESVSQIDTIGEPLDSGRLTATVLSKLSDEQLQTLETAYEMGYFDVPRRTSTRRETTTTPRRVSSLWRGRWSTRSLRPTDSRLSVFLLYRRPDAITVVIFTQ